MMRSNSGELTGDFFTATPAWNQKYPGAHAGILALRDAENPVRSEPLEDAKRQLEEHLRRSHAGKDRAALLEDPVLRAYAEHYRRFNKTYHVQLQLESILFKGKSLPGGAGLVEAMFMAEIESRLLTAGHDLSAVDGNLRLDVASGSETYTLMRGTQQSPKAGDMMICDDAGIISSIVYGPDERTQIRPETREAVFTVYAPHGVTPLAIEAHLRKMADYARIIAPTSKTALLQVYPTGLNTSP